MTTEAQYNALHAIAKKCSAEMKAISRKNLSARAEVSKRFAVDAKLLGFTHTGVMVEIGRVNGILKNRRLD